MRNKLNKNSEVAYGSSFISEIKIYLAGEYHPVSFKEAISDWEYNISEFVVDYKVAISPLLRVILGD